MNLEAFKGASTHQLDPNTEISENHEFLLVVISKKPVLWPLLATPPQWDQRLGGTPHLRGHAVGDAEGQVLQDALHAVIVLLARGAQVLLQGPGHGREDGLGGLPGVHHLPRGLLLLLGLEALDVDEGFLHRNH